jgi:RNA polymerase sigma-70 factor (ECF subfamily)
MLTRADLAMERYAAGDDSAFGEVYDAVAPRVLAVAMRALGDAALAEDVVQQTMLNLHRARGSFIPGAEVQPWAHAIASRLVVDTIRRHRRDRRLEAAETRVPTPAIDPRPDDEAIARETAACLRVAFAALPHSQQSVLVLRDRGLSLAAVASALGTTVAAVKLRLHRAGTSLRAAIARSGKGARP